MSAVSVLDGIYRVHAISVARVDAGEPPKISIYFAGDFEEHASWRVIRMLRLSSAELRSLCHVLGGLGDDHVLRPWEWLARPCLMVVSASGEHVRYRAVETTPGVLDGI